MNISISTGLYYRKNYKEVFDIIKSSGCKNIELFFNQAIMNIGIDELCREIGMRDLKVLSIHLPLTFIAYERNEDEKTWFERGIKYAERLNAQVITSHFSYKQENGTRVNNDESHLKNIKDFSRAAGICICTENLPKSQVDTILQYPDKLIEFLETNNCSVTYDTTHSATHNRNIVGDYRLYKKYIRNIHLSDYSHGAEHKVPGDGILPIGELIKELVKDKYQYPLTIELDFENTGRNKVSNDTKAVELLKKSINYIEDAIEQGLGVAGSMNIKEGEFL